MKTVLIVLVIMLLTSLTAYSQTKFCGIVYEEITNNPIPYAFVSVTAKSAGVVGDEIGRFCLENEKIDQTDSILITCLGYYSKVIATKDWTDEVKLFMKLKPIELNDAVITAKRYKEIKIGVSSAGTKMLFTPLFLKRELKDNSLIGREIGAIMDIKKDCRIKSLNLHIAKNSYENAKIRVLFYNVENGLPSQIIVDKDIIIDINLKSGLFSADLSQYDINLPAGSQIAVTLMILDETNRNELFIFAKMLGNNWMVRRDQTLGEWKKTKTAITLFLVGEY